MEDALPMRPEVKLSGWRGHLTALAIVACTILALFHRDLLGMVAIWWNASTYGHCLFVPILVAWLVQQRLPGLRRLEPSAWAPGLLWLGLGAFAWMLGAAAGVAVVRHGALVMMLQGSVIALLGPAVARALLFPLFYAFFMVPFGEEIVAPLQLATAHISMILLGLTGVPAQMQGIFITTPNGYFEVAEACSGAKFVIAMTAYGLLVCNVCFTSWRRRVAFMVGALSLSILANGVRAFATIFVAEVTTIDAAAGFDHVVYGWLFFAVIMIVVMAIAWPFFDRQPGDPWFDPEDLRHKGHSATGAVAGVALAMIVAAPLWLAASAAAGQPLPGAPAMPQVKGWVRSDEPPLRPWQPRFDGADHLAMARYGDAKGQVVDLAIATFDRQDEGRELVGFGQGAAGADSGWTWSQPAPAPGDARGEQITGPGRVVRHVVSFYVVGGGRPTGSAHLVKLATMKARLLGGDRRAAAIMVSAEERAGRSADAAIAAFLHDLGDVKDLADRSLGTR
ncbi:EpsI domain-containing exosortase [Sphingobium indicum]|uniref:Exosortase A n=2 Tax=Sphingobium indicum TaxID=332055 RepID=A0A1L5BN47_SPHIB|nr:EpsI domain-containing exosortase [Sphingobium indicum]APL94283.1 exosortase A [Sphingobium indicum B90A]NYI21162.1 exosortase A [Sphingobium indicum]RYM04025.1 EpsI domain-containing exosortase [Sphingobium indicum]